MIANFNLKTMLAEPPKLHEKQGRLISDWRIDDTTCLELNGRLKPGMNTLETGAGLSTIIFAANGCQHTCIMPDKALADRVQDYCRSASIDTGNVRFIISKSCDVIHQVSRSGYDLILIDGCHGLPSVFVDFCYAAKALKLGGTLIVDDMHIYTCHLIACFMQSDPGWNVELMTKRVAVGIKISDTIDNEWHSQRFVVLRSSGSSLFARALLKARITVRNLLTHGARE
jgi:Methyltransferase domain